MAKPYQVTIDGIVWCGAFHITKNGMVEFHGFPHPDYDSDELANLLALIKGENE